MEVRTFCCKVPQWVSRVCRRVDVYLILMLCFVAAVEYVVQAVLAVEFFVDCVYYREIFFTKVLSRPAMECLNGIFAPFHTRCA